MRDVIEKVVATESAAKLIVAEAKAEADRISSDSEKKKKALMEQARLEALTEADRILEEGLREALEEKERRIREAGVRIENDIRIDEAAKERAVSGVVRCVSGLE